MRHRIYETVIAVACIGWLVSLTGAFYVNMGKAPSLLVVVTRDLSANQKIATGDLQFALRREPRAKDEIENPDDAVGACTRAPINRGQTARWSALVRLNTPDNSCASTDIALRTLQAMLEIPQQRDGAPGAGRLSDAAVVARRIIQVLTGDNGLLNDATTAALGEFRGEFIKELSKRLADNAGDRLFGRDQLPGNGKLSEYSPTALQFSHVTYFGAGRSDLQNDEREFVIRVATDILRNTDCQILLNAYTDRSGHAPNNLWLSLQRGNSVSSVLVARGINRRWITVIPHGEADASVGAAAGTAAASDRRVEIQATCKVIEATKGG